MRPVLIATTLAVAAIGLGACGTQGIELSSDDPGYEGAVLFAERCGGCHTLAAAGTEGSGDQALRIQGPDFDQRTVSEEDTLFAIQHGGFSGAIMPQNIVVGDEAEAVASFLAEHSGGDVLEETGPTEPLEGP